MRKGFPGMVAAILLLSAAPAARADLGPGDIADAIEEALAEPFANLFALLELIVTRAKNLPENLVNKQIRDLRRVVEAALNSYLGEDVRAVLDVLNPNDPVWVTVGDAKWYVNERLKDRKARVEEAMTFAAGLAREMPEKELRLATLSAMTMAPEGMFATDQVGNEINLETAGALVKMNGLLAELGQLEADQRVQEDWQKVMNYKWAKYHYQDTAFWTGDRTWEPETVDTGW